jgi:hypothetical protein
MHKIALIATLLASVAGGAFVVANSPPAMACNTPSCDQENPATVPGQPASPIADPALTDYPITLPGEPC